MTRGTRLNQLVELYAATGKLLHAQFQRCFAALGLAPSQVHVLFILGEAQAPLTPKALAQKLHHTPGAITQILEPLVTANLVARTPSLHDRRQIWLTLSDAGKTRLSELQKLRKQLLARLLSDLSDSEITTMLQIQQKMLHTLDATPASDVRIANKKEDHNV
jgi:DNA-binding MarR family transcriptional regulator